MRRIVVLSVAVIWILGCSAAVRWEKSGVSDAQRQRDETECVSLASREGTIPTAQTTATSPTTPIDPQRTRVQGYDVVKFDECMKTRGYQQVAPARSPG
jgi:hypothetical protein